jgi:hypothetical protein
MHSRWKIDRPGHISPRIEVGHLGQQEPKRQYYYPWLPRLLRRIHDLAGRGEVRFTLKAARELAALDAGSTHRTPATCWPF